MDEYYTMYAYKVYISIHNTSALPARARPLATPILYC